MDTAGRVISMKCDGCNAHCCRKFVKFIRIHDVARIINALHIDPTEFTNLLSAQGIASEMPKIKINGKKYVLALDSKMGKKECIFLLNIGNAKKCGIYSARPVGCQTYPYKMNSETVLELADSFICPWQYWPKGEEREKYFSILRQAASEQREYKEIVDAWNKKNGTGNVISFVNFALGRLEG